MVHYIGLDVSLKQTSICVVDQVGSVVARSWRGILPLTHLAREGRMTVTIGRRELLAALGGVSAAWPFAAHAQQAAVCDAP